MIPRPFSAEGFVEDGGATGFIAVQHFLQPISGFVELGKKAFNFIYDTLLLRKRRERYWVISDVIHIYTLLSNCATISIDSTTDKSFRIDQPISIK